MRSALARLLACAGLALALVACGAEQDGTDEPAGPDAGARTGEPAGFMETCEPAGDECADGLVCFQFNSRGPHCTHDCALDADCPEPSRGCNNMGVCKAP